MLKVPPATALTWAYKRQIADFKAPVFKRKFQY